MRRSRYPCGICNKGAVYSAICCTTCSRWYHSRCLKLPKRHLVTLTVAEVRSWQCKSCVMNDLLPLDTRIKLYSSVLKLQRISTLLYKTRVELRKDDSAQETKMCTNLLPLAAAVKDTAEGHKYEYFWEGLKKNSELSEKESVTQPTIQTGGEAMEEDPYEFSASPAKSTRKTRAVTRAGTVQDEAFGSAVTDEELLARDAGTSAVVTLASPTEISSERFQAFKSSLVEVFRAERASSLSLVRVVEFANGAQSGDPYQDGEVSAAIERLTEANQVMHADGILFLI